LEIGPPMLKVAMTIPIATTFGNTATAATWIAQSQLIATRSGQIRTRRTIAGATIAPQMAPAPMIPNITPIKPGPAPSCCARTIRTRISALQAKFCPAATATETRRNGWRHTARRPSAISVRSRDLVAMLGAANGVRIDNRAMNETR